MMAEWKPETIDFPISQARIEILSPIKEELYRLMREPRIKPIRFHHIPMVAEVRIWSQGESTWFLSGLDFSDFSERSQ
jgi:hypothetical protein